MLYGSVVSLPFRKASFSIGKYVIRYMPVELGKVLFELVRKGKMQYVEELLEGWGYRLEVE